MDKESKNGHSGAKKTNRFQSGFRVKCRFFQTEQTVNRKKSGFRASRQGGLCSLSLLQVQILERPKTKISNQYLFTNRQTLQCTVQADAGIIWIPKRKLCKKHVSCFVTLLKNLNVLDRREVNLKLYIEKFKTFFIVLP